jgi:hypothetical protein
MLDKLKVIWTQLFLATKNCWQPVVA